MDGIFLSFSFLFFRFLSHFALGVYVQVRVFGQMASQCAGCRFVYNSIWADCILLFFLFRMIATKRKCVYGIVVVCCLIECHMNKTKDNNHNITCINYAFSIIGEMNWWTRTLAHTHAYVDLDIDIDTDMLCVMHIFRAIIISIVLWYFDITNDASIKHTLALLFALAHMNVG